MPTAIAYLARTVRENPTNAWAAERLMSALTHRSFPLPALPLLRHPGAVHFAHFSGDGTRIVTACQDGTARLWDARTGQPLSDPLRHQAEVRTARFAPDVRFVVTAGDDKFARIWDAQTSQPVGPPLPHNAEVRSAEFSADGTKILTIAGQIVRVWDARTGMPLSDELLHRSGDPYVRSAQLGPDGLDLLTADGNTARLWTMPATTNASFRRVDTKWMQLARFIVCWGRASAGKVRVRAQAR